MDMPTLTGLVVMPRYDIMLGGDFTSLLHDISDCFRAMLCCVVVVVVVVVGMFIKYNGVALAIKSPTPRNHLRNL